MCCRFRPQKGWAAEGLAGDLAISVPTALRQAGEQGHALRVEIKVLILHGLLHLAGYDHETDTGQMARRESSSACAAEPASGADRARRKQDRVPKQDSPQRKSASPRVAVGHDRAASSCYCAWRRSSRRWPPTSAASMRSLARSSRREVQDNLDAWEEQMEPHLGLSREHAAISAGRTPATGAGR